MSPRGGGLERIPRSFWHEVAASRRRLLMLDYDGTLAPFQVDRLRALPPIQTLRVLRAAAQGDGTTVAIVSGRPVAELERLLGDLRAVMVGEHGWESRLPDGQLVVHALGREADRALGRAARSLEELGAHALLERKRTSVMLHTRGLSGREAARWIERARSMWETEAAGAGDQVRLVPVNGGLELRAVGRDKGSAVSDLIASSPPGTFAVYLGDDLTDEDAFRELSGGVGIRVGASHGRSLARHGLASWQEVGRFLQRWLTALSGAPAGAEAP